MNKPSDEFKKKLEQNEWETNLYEVIDFITMASSGQLDWMWPMNSQCKYVNLRFDMRDGAFILQDKDGNRISFEQLKWQYEDVAKPRDE